MARSYSCLEAKWKQKIQADIFLLTVLVSHPHWNLISYHATFAIFYHHTNYAFVCGLIAFHKQRYMSQKLCSPDQLQQNKCWKIKLMEIEGSWALLRLSPTPPAPQSRSTDFQLDPHYHELFAAPTWQVDMKKGLLDVRESTEGSRQMSSA